MAKFILFDGPDGSGKSTALEFSAQFIESRGNKVIKTREPGSSLIKINQQLREIVKFNSDINASEREFLFMADANRHAREIHALLLKNSNAWILSDRGLYSHLIYQQASGDIGLLSDKEVKLFHKLAKLVCYEPDYTIIFDVDYCVAKNRMVNRGRLDVIESLGEDFLISVNQGYKNIKAGHQLFKINANRNLPEVTEDLKKILLKIMAKERC